MASSGVSHQYLTQIVNRRRSDEAIRHENVNKMPFLARHTIIHVVEYISLFDDFLAYLRSLVSSIFIALTVHENDKCMLGLYFNGLYSK